MQDKTKLVGLVDIVVKKATGEIQRLSGRNTIDSELKNAITSGLNGAVSSGYGAMTSLFDGSNTGFVAPTSGESGIIVKTTANDYYQCATVGASSGNTGASVKLVGTLKANATKTIDIAYMGHGWSSGAAFDYSFATHDFSSNIALEDGDQLDITWTITIADS